MHSSKEIALVASALANQLRAGRPMDEAVGRLAGMQSKYADFWRQTSKSIGAGTPMSKLLVGVWPDSLVAAVKAGEDSGEVDKVFLQIDATIAIEGDVRGHMSQLLYPLGMSLAGLAIFVFFMSVVIPTLAKSFGVKKMQASVIMDLSFWMDSVRQEHGWTILAVFLVAIYGAVLWVRSPEGRQKISSALVDAPVLGPSLCDLSFGVWAHYMSTMVAAGVPTIEALEKTAGVLPLSLQDAVHAAVSDMKRLKPMSIAFDPSKVSAGDPRKRLPYYIAVAMKVAEETGLVAAELSRVAPSMINEGVRSLKIVISFFNLLGIVIAAASIVTPMGAYYIQLFGSINHLN